MADDVLVATVPGGEALPTRKGLTLRRETWEELLPVLERALHGPAAEVLPGEVGDGVDPFGDQ